VVIIIKKSMVAFVVEGAVGYDNIRGVRLGFLALLLLLRPDHDQGQLAGRLPDLVLLHDLLSVGGQLLAPLVVSGFGTLDVVDLVAGVVRIGVDGTLLLLLLLDAATSHDVETSLGFGDDLPVLVLFETDVLLPEVLLSRLVTLVD